MVGGRVARKAHGHYVSSGQKAVQRLHSIQFIHTGRLFPHTALNPYGMAAQGFHFGSEGGTDIPQADNKGRCSLNDTHMAFALPAALKLVNIIQIQFFTQQEQASQHMLGYRQSVCAGGIGKH